MVVLVVQVNLDAWEMTEEEAKEKNVGSDEKKSLKWNKVRRGCQLSTT
jgi:hypothetical protein